MVGQVRRGTRVYTSGGSIDQVRRGTRVYASGGSIK